MTEGAADIARFTGTEIYSSIPVAATAGGDLALTGCAVLPFNRSGFAGTAPNITFELSEMDRFGRIELSATLEAECALTLRAQSVDGTWHFDAMGNGDGLPELELTDAAVADGPLHVWVGTPDGATCDATVHINTWLF